MGFETMNIEEADLRSSGVESARLLMAYHLAEVENMTAAGCYTRDEMTHHRESYSMWRRRFDRLRAGLDEQENGV